MAVEGFDDDWTNIMLSVKDEVKLCNMPLLMVKNDP